MQLYFKNLPVQLEKGLHLLTSEHAFQIHETGLPITLISTQNNTLSVHISQDAATIEYAQPIHFFRGLGILLDALNSKAPLPFTTTETVAFDTLGVMFDVSQGNAVITPEAFQAIIRRMAVMGLNMLMLYMEDSFVLQGHPFFGYMRPKYTQDDFKQIDDYASLFGIEVIPAIQTLAHLTDALKWSNAYGDITDCTDILLVGEDKTYTFIEHMLSHVTSAFRSRRVHIGMDEAYKLGRGQYQERHGIRDKYSIMREHLIHVCKITEKLGLTPMMWSDMFFTPQEPAGYGDNFDPNVQIPEGAFDGIPDSLNLVFWEYNQVDPNFYQGVIKKHQELNHPVIFAGGVYNCHGFGVNNGLAVDTIITSLSACHSAGIKEAFLTVWGDDGTENNIMSVLLAFSAFAEQGYHTNPEAAQLKQRFATCTGGNYDDFMNLRYIDEIPGVPAGNPTMSNPCKYLCWQNPLLGLYDKNIEGLGLNAHYEEWAKKYASAKARNPLYQSVFDMAEKLCAVLSLKAELGLGMQAAYKAGDKTALAYYGEVIIPELISRYSALRAIHRDYWFATNKPEGWEIIDLRYGTQLNWLDTAAYRIKSYTEGRISAIGELENERLTYPGSHQLPLISMYSKIVSASRVGQTDNHAY